MKQELKNEFNINSPQYHEINICDAYVYYCKIMTSIKNNEMVASKSYFEKHVFEYLSDYIIESKYIDVEWLMT